MKIQASINKREVSKLLKNVNKYEAKKLDRLKSLIKGKTLLVHAKALDKVPVNEGVLRSSTSPKFENDGLTGVIESNANYALFVHEGRGPGSFPNLRLLARWAYLRGITRNDNLDDNKTKSTVFLIGRKIARQGTKGNPYLRDAFNEGTVGFLRELKSEIKAIEKL